MSVDIAFRSPEFMNGRANGACPVDSSPLFRWNWILIYTRYSDVRSRCFANDVNRAFGSTPPASATMGQPTFVLPVPITRCVL
jgi:hypothetical protein